jgi:hypothetical protein
MTVFALVKARRKNFTSSFQHQITQQVYTVETIQFLRKPLPYLAVHIKEKSVVNLKPMNK